MKKIILISVNVFIIISCTEKKPQNDEMNQLMNEVSSGIKKNKEIMENNKFEPTVIDSSDSSYDLKFKRDTNYRKTKKDDEIFEVVKNSKDKSVSK